MQANNPGSLNIRKRIKFLGRDFLVYGVAAAGSKAFSLIMFPVLAHKFSVEEFGLIDLMNTMLTFLTAFFVFGQDQALARYYYEEQSVDKRRELISQTIWSQVFVIIPVIAALYIFAGSFSELLFNSSNSLNLTRILIIQTPFIVILHFALVLTKWTFDRNKYLILSVGSLVFSVLAALLTIFFIQKDVYAVLASYAVVRAFFALLGIFLIRKWLYFPSNFSFITKLFKFAWPLGIITVVGAFVPTLQRFFVSWLDSGYNLGLFSAAAKMGMIVSLVAQAFYSAWGPFSLAIHKEENAVETYNWVLKGYTLCISSAVMIVVLISGPLINLLTSGRFEGSASAVFPLTMGLAVQSIAWITGIGTGLSKKTYLNLYSYILFLAVSATSMYFLFGMIGFAGVAWGGMAGYFAKSIAETFFAQRSYPMKWQFKGVVMVIFLVTLAGIAIELIRIENNFHASIVSGAGALLIPIAGWYLLFSKEDRRRISVIGHRGVKRLTGNYFSKVEP